MTPKRVAALLLVWLLLLVIGVVQALPDTRGPPWAWLAYAVVGASVVVFLASLGSVWLVLRNFLALLPRLGRLATPDRITVQAAGLAGAGMIAVAGGLAFWEGLRWDLMGPGTDSPARYGITDPTDSSQFDSVLAYAQSLDYDNVGHGAADSAWLTETRGDSVLRTVRGYIEPQLRAHLNRHSDLDGTGPGEGRIVARVRVDPTDGRGYPPLNFPPGVSYLWVDSLNGDTYRMLIIPASGDRVLYPPDTATRTYLRHPRRYANYSIARWVLADNTECANKPCDGHGCCQICP